LIEGLTKAGEKSDNILVESRLVMLDIILTNSITVGIIFGFVLLLGKYIAALKKHCLLNIRVNTFYIKIQYDIEQYDMIV
jgi:hypothetical protein